MTAITGTIAILGWLIGGMLALVLAILFVPFRIAARVDGLDLAELPPEDAGEPNDVDAVATAWHVRADWLWGVVRFQATGGLDNGAERELRVLGFRRSLSTSKGIREARDGDHQRPRVRTMGRRTARRRGPRSGSALAPRLGLALLSEASWFVPRLWRALGVQINGALTYGFPDPFLTGISQAIMAHMPLSPQLRLTPDYMQGRLTGSVEAKATIVPLKSVAVVIRTAFRPAIRQIWWPQLRSAMRLSKAG